MLNWKGAVLFLLTVGLTVSQFGWIEPKQNSGVQPLTNQVAETGQALSAVSDLPLWNIDYAKSYIKFSGDQAGAPFSGQWQSWRAELQFDSAKITAAHFDVQIDIASVASGDAERDGYIVSEDFFHQARFARARFVADEFATDPAGFTAAARLTMKGVTLPVTFQFRVEKSAGQTVLIGKARLDRLAWDIGAGDWSDTSWVGQYVDVDVLVTANH